MGSGGRLGETQLTTIELTLPQTGFATSTPILSPSMSLLVAVDAANQELAASQSKVQQQVTKCEEADAKVIADEAATATARAQVESSRAKAATARAQVEETKLELKQKQQAAKMADDKLKKRRTKGSTIQKRV